MFHGSTTSVPLFAMRCPTVPASLFHCSSISFHCFTISCSIVPPLDVLLFHHLCSSVSPSGCSTVARSDDLLFPDLFSNVPLSDVLLFHHQMFQCAVIRCSTVPPPLFHCSAIRCCTDPSSDVPLFQHLFHFSTVVL